MDRKYKNFIYDNFALGDECHRFGIIAGCKPNCPVFERGDCKNNGMILKVFKSKTMKEYKIVHKTKPILFAYFWGIDGLKLAKKWVADWNTVGFYDNNIKTIRKEDLEIVEV